MVGNNGKKQEELRGGEMDSASNDLGKITPRTEEERYIAMLLDVMRGANKQDRAVILGTIDSFCLKYFSSFSPSHSNEAVPAMDMPFSRKHTSPKEEVREGQTPPEKEPKKEKMTIEFDYADQDTVEYGFCFINGILALTQVLSTADGDSWRSAVPEDFYQVIAEARDRLDKIRVILGYLH